MWTADSLKSYVTNKVTKKEKWTAEKLQNYGQKESKVSDTKTSEVNPPKVKTAPGFMDKVKQNVTENVLTREVPENVRDYMKNTFGIDKETVRIHRDPVQEPVQDRTAYALNKLSGLGRGAISAATEGVVNAAGGISDLIGIATEGGQRLLGMNDSADRVREMREKERAGREKLIGEIRDDFGIGEMSGLGQAAYGAVSSIPQMLSGPLPFFLSSAGQYAADAERKGATIGQALAQGLAGGAIESTLESALGYVPGVKNLKNAAGGLKRIAKNIAGEALEEGITEPLSNLTEKLIFNPDKQIVDFSEIGSSALSGALMATMLAPFGGGGNVQQTTTKPKQNLLKGKLESFLKRSDSPTQQTKIQDQALQAEPTVQQPKMTREGAELVQKHKQAKLLKQEYEQIKSASKLTPDELTIAEDIRKGRLSEVPQGYNAQIINDVASAGKLYDHTINEIKAFNKNRKQELANTMNDLLKTSDTARDKAGWQLARDTQERNSIAVFGEDAGKKINETVFRPVHENEARGTRFANKYIARVKALRLSKAESEAVQMLGEGKITENDLPATMDKTKIKNAVNEFRKIYDELISLANDVLVKNGYDPVDYRKDYFPHFEEPTDPFVVAMKNLGFRVDNMELPTDIAGITHQFRPGKKWFGNFLRREGQRTTYDALQGFERYIHGIKDVIFHTYDIQRLRAFETAIRKKYAPDNIKNRITEIEASDLSHDEKQAAIDDLFDIGKGHLGSYVTNLREYTDNLAGKKSVGDRNIEHKMGRGIYNIMTNLESQIAKNMIGFNVSSWLTNFIPLAQAGAGITTKNMIKAARDTVMSYYKDDGFINRSTFLTNRKGVDRLSKTTVQKIADAGMAPMKWIDDFSSQIITRGRYYDAIEKGMDPKEAMAQADSYAAGAIGDRSKGALPTVFNTKNPLTKLFTLFQVEVNNQLSFIFKDLPAMAKQEGVKWVASTILKFMVGSWLFNEIYEALTGRRPAIDPIGTVKKALEQDTPLEAVQSVGEDVLDQTPFVGGLLPGVLGISQGGGRLPISAALPNFSELAKGDTKELLKPLYYLASPIGGGGQVKKTIEGITAYSQGASKTDSGRVRFPIEQNIGNAIRTTLFGQYSTPEAREYFSKGRAPMSEDQSKKFNKLVDYGLDPNLVYEMFDDLKKYNTKEKKQRYILRKSDLTERQKLKFAEVYFK
jgi:hypothetical protein